LTSRGLTFALMYIFCRKARAFSSAEDVKALTQLHLETYTTNRENLISEFAGDIFSLNCMICVIDIFQNYCLCVRKLIFLILWRYL